jgi:hypothetical protein
MSRSTEVDVLISRIVDPAFPPSGGTAVGKQEILQKGEPWFHCWRRIAAVNSTTVVRQVVDYSDIYDFRQRVVSIPGVVAVLAEPGPGGERHITTFLSSESDEAEEQVYEVEAAIIDKYCNRVFDFHLRVVPRDEHGRPLLSGGPFYLLTWQPS